MRQRRVVALDVHQHEAGGVPQLVAEVAVALAAVQVELDVAAGLARLAKVKRRASVPKAGMPFGNSLRVFFSIFRPVGVHQAGGALLTRSSMPMPSIRSMGSSTLPLDLDIFWPFGIADQAMHVDVRKGILPVMCWSS